MVVYDNGNERPDDTSRSRGVVIEYDETDMTADIVWEHEILPWTPFLGDADRLSNGNVLLSAGGTECAVYSLGLAGRSVAAVAAFVECHR